MKVVVTGGSGQLGTVVVRKLIRDRSIQKVVVLDLQPPIVASRKVEFTRADVRDSGLERHFEGADAVFHFAFLVTQVVQPGVFQSVNVEGSKNVFRAVAAAGVPTLVYSSSVAAYGIMPGHPDLIVEETPRQYQANFPYAAAKFEVEAFLDEFEPAHSEIAISRLRPVILAGRRMEHPLGRALRAGLMPDPGSPPASFVWDEDVAQAAVLAMKQRARGAFVLAADDPIPSAEIAAEGRLRRVPVPREALRKGIRFVPQPVLDLLKIDPSWLENDRVGIHVSSRRAREELGWKPKYPTTRDVAKALGAAAIGRPDPRIPVFLRLAARGYRQLTAGRADQERLRADIHLELLGRGGGDYTLSFGGGQLNILSGAPRPPLAVVTIATSIFLDLLAGRMVPATAEITGKIRLEGEPIGVLIVSRLVNGFRERLASRGSRAWVARQLAKWFEMPIKAG